MAAEADDLQLSGLGGLKNDRPLGKVAVDHCMLARGHAREDAALAPGDLGCAAVILEMCRGNVEKECHIGTYQAAVARHAAYGHFDDLMAGRPGHRGQVPG